MKRILLPVAITVFPIFVIGVFIFISAGYYTYKTNETKDSASFQRRDNGFGGEEGFKVVDSGYSADRYFWIDNDILVFNENFRSNEPGRKRAYVWNIATNNISQIEKKGGVNCYRDGYIYYSEAAGKVDAKGNKIRRIYRAVLRNDGERWFLENSKDIEDIWPLPSDRYELQWTEECMPWFRLKREARTDQDVPEHRFKYLPEWGWIMRMPNLGSENYSQSRPSMGVIDIDYQIYRGQHGIKISELPNINAKNIKDIRMVYIWRKKLMVIMAKMFF